MFGWRTWKFKGMIAIVLLCVAIFATQVGAYSKPKTCLTECKPRFGIVSAFGAEADLLLAATKGKTQFIINGNTFTTGELQGNWVVIVLTGISVENASMVTQLMIDHFNTHHLLLSGIAGGVDPSQKVGDVVIPDKWASPLEVYFSRNSQVPAPCGTLGDLSCLGLKLSKFTSTANSDWAGTGLFMRETFVRNQSNLPNGEFKFDYKVDPKMLKIAKTVNPKLDRCGPKNPTLCVATQPVVRVGGRGISGSAFLANPSYRDYAFKTIAAISMDMETAAFAHVAYANEIPFIAFRSLSDLAGGDDVTDVSAFFGSGLAESNLSKLTLGFLAAWAAKG
jgi:adenosylhomocysteine nucleosidase